MAAPMRRRSALLLLALLAVLAITTTPASAQRWRTDQSYRPFGKSGGGNGGGNGGQQQQQQQQSNQNNNNQNNNNQNNNPPPSSGSSYSAGSIRDFFSGGRLPDAGPVLRLHNTFRALHVAQPLAWDEQLAKDAQSWADRCKWRHADANSGEKPRDQGENMYWSLRYSAEESGARAVKAWYREVADVDWRASMDRRAREPGRMVGHATQLLWRSTAKVGCGYSQCAQLEGSPAGSARSDGSRADFVVCRYWPTGNYQGQMEKEVLPGKLGGPEVGR